MRAATVSTDELYERAAAGLPCWVSDATERRIELPMSRWFGHADAAEADRNADHAMLARCVGSTVDLGCGPGRFTAALNARGTAALGVDSSAVAVRMTIARGALAVQRDMFAPQLPGTGAWSRVLLADGNIGIGGEPVRVLRRAGELLRAGGLAVVEIDRPGTGLRYADLRFQTENAVGEWFRWARVGVDAIAEVAAAAGMTLLEVAEVAGRFIATIAAPRDHGQSR
ncbi:MAG: class I SAM-dependent methyltransferase [Actinomycetota bacterium]|nr:class I SAM-dependent methyltransferase [Actinomycetota bacterium]